MRWRASETVGSDGPVVFLTSAARLLSKLHPLTMETHALLRTEAYRRTMGRFYEGFVLSVMDCRASIVADNDFNLPSVWTPMQKGLSDVKAAS